MVGFPPASFHSSLLRFSISAFQRLSFYPVSLPAVSWVVVIFIFKVKNPVEITLRTIHVGDARRVVTLDIDGKDPAREFLMDLARHDRNQFESILTRIRSISNHPRYENQITFRHVGDGIHEFKRPGLRLYAFYDEIDGRNQLILCTNGGSKNKRQQKDIRLAKSRKDDYFSIKNHPETILKWE